MKKLALLSSLLMIGFSYGQIQKKKKNSKKIALTTNTIPLKSRIGCKIVALNSDSYAVISPTRDPITSVVEDPENTIYSVEAIEVLPDYPGGNIQLFNFISKNFQYTNEMIENEIKGKILVSFVVEKDGSISNLKTVRGLGFGAEDEALRVLKLMPKWAPGEQNGKKVRCSYVIPIMIYATKQ